MPLTITIGGACYAADPADRARFENRHWTRLPGLFDDGLLRRFEAALSNTAFAELSHQRVASDSTDLRVMGAAASELLVLLCNDPVVLRAVEDMTGCAPLTRFNGSVYRMRQDEGHRQAWHDDLIDGRSVTLSVNVGGSYGGGVLEIRERATRRTIAQVPNPGRGDGILFRLDRALEHRVTPVTNGAKTAFAGWFRRGTPLRDELRAAV
jgi:predicted 2-oxoglutarate/Fe(II)-dependent dioxygenase YbiX